MNFLFLLILAGVLYVCFKKIFRTFFDPSFGGEAPYHRNYTPNRNRVKLPSRDNATGKAQGVPQCKFLLSAKQQLQRDYMLIVDRSGSMSGSRWQDAEEAVKALAPYICRFDPDGVDIILFSSSTEIFSNVKSPEEVESIFQRHRPSGSTNLALALHRAFCKHFEGSRGATTLLVVTDGEPDSQSEVERVIRRAANSILEDEELSVSFIQIGDDRNASRFLKHLDDSITNARFDIVDTIKAEDAAKMSFPELIARSIYD